MKRLTTTLAAMALLACICAPAAHGFGLTELDVTFDNEDGSPATQAGSHPFSMTTTVGFETKPSEEVGFEIPDGDPKDLRIAQMPGLIGDPTAAATCSNAAFAAGAEDCPPGSQVGRNLVTFNNPDETTDVPVFSLPPPPGVAMKLGFYVLVVPVTVEIGINESLPSNVIASLSNIANVLPVYRSELTLWGVPADSRHDDERVGGGSAGGPPVPFLTVPRACTGPLPTAFEAFSWQGDSFAQTILTHDGSEPPAPLGMTGCGKLAFNPSIEAKPTSKAAQSPTGLDLSLDVADEGLTNPDGLAGSDIRKALITMPEGMTANPSLAEGLGVCSEAQLARETAKSAPGEGCPNASKIGTVEVQTPLLDESLGGSLFIATPYENPFDSLIALYLVIENQNLGIVVRQPVEVRPDPVTGQLTGIATDIPQLPFSHFKLHFREGGRSPLISPPSCGTHTLKAQLTPWAGGPPLTTTSTFQVIAGPNGGPCPAAGTRPLDPGFSAGTLNNSAGGFSPFHMRITRSDGEQDITRFSAKLPPGMVAKLAGTTQCPDGAIARARSKTGLQERANPSCPASSEIGDVLAGAGVGSQLTYVGGRIYLSGPTNGAPLSVVAIVPAVAGPFDVGTVVTRQALRIDPRTAEVSADGEASDPIPHILAGIPLNVRDIRVHVDKESFTLNPTSCDPFATEATLWGGGTNVFSTADDSPLQRSARFQAADCASLGFAPNLALRLKGGTKRGGHPALTGTYAPRAGDANLSGLLLRLPRSAFLDQAHIRTICTRVQFAADACPQGAVYGQATAHTPILSEPLKGPVYLRSSSHNLPDFVADLHGLVDVEAVARIDSVKGGIRASFEDVPDAPLSKVVVRMQGAKKGLIVNSTDLCLGRHRAGARFAGHNGKVRSLRPVVGASCGTKGGRKDR